MRSVLAALGAVLVAASHPAAQDPPDLPNNDFCVKVFDCDCAGVNAGLLTRDWRAECRQCEAGIRAQCAKILTETGSPLAAHDRTNYCDTCVIRGSNWRPQPPDTVAIETGWKPAYPGQTRIFCPKGARFDWGRYGSSTPMSADGTVFQGCLKGAERDGAWSFYDEKAKTERIVVYRNGRVLHQSDPSMVR